MGCTSTSGGSPPGQGGAPEAETTKKPAGDGGLLKFKDLERVGCLLPWEEGEEAVTISHLTCFESWVVVGLECCVASLLNSPELRLVCDET
jgi:hypothetical protein